MGLAARVGRSSAAGAVLLSFLAASATAVVAAPPTRDAVIGAAQEALTAAGLTCAVADAAVAERDEAPVGFGRRGGRLNSSPGPASTAYEVACLSGLGFILVNAPPARENAPAVAQEAGTQGLNCLEAVTAAERGAFPYQCRLKANRDQARALQALLRRGGLDCAIEAARGLGHTQDRSYFEIACAATPGASADDRAGAGYVLITDRSVRDEQSALAVSCFDVEANPNLRCRLTHVAAIINDVRRYVARFAPGCVPANQRLIGRSEDGGLVFEVVCESGTGYVARRTPDGVMDALLPCSDPSQDGQCLLDGRSVKP